MSRTNKGQKGPGYDYWGRRALSQSCGYGPHVKKLTHHIERGRVDDEIKRELKEAEKEDMAICSACGQAVPVSQISRGMTECIWC